MGIQDFSFIIIFLASLCWAIGLVNPKMILRWIKRPTRIQLTVYFICLIVLGLALGQISDQTSLAQKMDEWIAHIGTNESKQQHTSEISDTQGQELIVHYIDVGQGDSTFLQGPDFSILIDAGRHDENEVVAYLQSLNIDSLDLVVGTHPHADHIGQMDDVLTSFKVEEVWMSGEMSSSRTFEQALDAISDSEAEYYEPRAGESFQIGSAHIDVISPKELIGDMNQSSISMRIQYGEVSFLFTGDAEKEMEEEMIRSGHNIQADIFQLGHHGSSTSNTKKFLEQVQPEIAIYSAGKDNSYGHPHDEVIQRLKQMGIPVYGTDRHGTIKVKTDGKQYSIETEKKVQ